MDNFRFALIICYPDSSLDYRYSRTYKTENTARNVLAKLTLADPSISTVVVRQLLNLSAQQLQLPIK